MGDERLRDYERRWRASGALADEVSYLQERLRLGDLSATKLQLCALLGPPAACAVLDVQAPAEDDVPQWLEAQGWGDRFAAQARWIHDWRQASQDYEAATLLLELLGLGPGATAGGWGSVVLPELSPFSVWVQAICLWGREVSVRAGLAAARACLPALPDDGSRDALGDLLRRIEVWLACPDEGHLLGVRAFVVHGDALGPSDRISSSLARVGEHRHLPYATWCIEETALAAASALAREEPVRRGVRRELLAWALEGATPSAKSFHELTGDLEALEELRAKHSEDTVELLSQLDYGPARIAYPIYEPVSLEAWLATLERWGEERAVETGVAICRHVLRETSGPGDEELWEALEASEAWLASREGPAPRWALGASLQAARDALRRENEQDGYTPTTADVDEDLRWAVCNELRAALLGP